MRLALDATFWEQLDRFGFRFCCEDCVHHDASARRCVHEWPTDEHRGQRFASREVRQVLFCKEFELR